jgi:hypothetical protein
MLGACAAGRSDASDTAGAGGVVAPSRTSRTQPPGSDPEAVHPYLVDLLARYDDVVNEIVTDPGEARHRDSSRIEAYLSLYEPDSEFADVLIDAWVERADAGLATRRLDDDQPISRSRIDGEIESRSDDEVSFPYCVERHFTIYDGAGRLLQQVAGRRQRGGGVAVRVEGRWRLRELTVRANTGACRSE